MNFGSIRFRLAAWYFLSVALILILFGTGAWLALERSIVQAADHDLESRLKDVCEFVDKQLTIGPNELAEELEEEIQLGLGSGLVELSDGTGRVLYRSTRLGNALAAFHASPERIGAMSLSTRQKGASYLRVASEAVVLKGRLFGIQVAQPLDEFLESMERFRMILLILAPLFLLLASLGGYWISSRALAPVDRITQEARSISIANLSTRLETPGAKDELHRLTETLNQMLDRIETSVKRVVQFTADASHELRAPLTLIQTAAEFSLRRERTRDELIEAVRKILRECERTARLVDELLLLARADSGADELRMVPLDVAETGRSAIDQAVVLAEPKHITVATEIPVQPVTLQGDEQALARLWLILLDNAVKYTNDGGHITFSMQAVNSHVEVAVSDTGIGIAPQDLAHVYDRFWRADKVRSRNSGGTGLGLSIARWIVERHGGSIAINSEPGRGSRVLVALPLSHATGIAAQS